MFYCPSQQSVSQLNNGRISTQSFKSPFKQQPIEINDLKKDNFWNNQAKGSQIKKVDSNKKVKFWQQ